MIMTIMNDASRVSVNGYACPNALSSRPEFLRARAVSPIHAPSTGEVRPQAGSDVLMAKQLVDGTKAGVRVRSLGPPI